MSLPVVLKVELLLNATWTDVTAYVRQDPGVNITFGIQNEGGIADPSEARLTFNNTDGRFTPRNTAGAYYPYLTRNTPLRVSVGAVIRYYGSVAEWPVRWNENKAVVTVPIVGAGDLRRLSRANALDSTLKSGILGLAASSNITGYWPIEDAAGSTSIGSGLTGGPNGVILNSPDFASIDPGIMSAPVANWNGGSAYLNPPAGSSGTAFTAGFLLTLPTGGTTHNAELFRVRSAGTADDWIIYFDNTGGDGRLWLDVYSNLGVLILSQNIGPFGLNGKSTYIKIEATNAGADVTWYAGAVTGGSGGTLVGRTVGAPYAAAIGDGTVPIAADVGISHVVLGKTSTAISSLGFDAALIGYAGETVNARMTRLGALAGVAMALNTGLFTPAEMGAQPDGSALDAMRAAEAADAGGILRDALNVPGLTYTPRTARYNDNGSPTLGLLTLDYSAGHLSPPLEPTDDDQQIRNDVTVNRVGGSTARQVLTSGALSTADYPNGVGPYRYETTLATYLDSQLPYVAGWLLGLGTVNETRWPRITIDLVKNSSLVTMFDSLRPGGRVRITNLPAICGVAAVDLQCVGWVESVTAATRSAELVCVPATPWQVVELDDTVFGELDVMHLAL